MQKTYIIYVNGTRMGREFGWYNATLLYRKMKRRYPGCRVTKIAQKY